MEDIRIIALRLFVALVISAVIGCERSLKRHSAGLRTFMIVTMSGTVAMLLDTYLVGDCTGPHLYVFSGISLVAAVSISVHSLFRNSRNQIEGLTTAAALWTSCLIGIATGYGAFVLAAVTTALLLVILSMLPWLEGFLKDRSYHFEIHLELTSAQYLENFITTVRRLGMSVDDIELNQAYEASNLSVYSISMTIQSKELKQYKTHQELITALDTLEYVSYIEEM
jgi:putative Mg2+ transporter-C (MgtC) family protein